MRQLNLTEVSKRKVKPVVDLVKGMRQVEE